MVQENGSYLGKLFRAEGLGIRASRGRLVGHRRMKCLWLMGNNSLPQ